jgi:hypothetical protein
MTRHSTYTTALVIACLAACWALPVACRDVYNIRDGSRIWLTGVYAYSGVSNNLGTLDSVISTSGLTLATASNSFATKGYVDGATNAAVMKSGDAMLGDLIITGSLKVVSYAAQSGGVYLDSAVQVRATSCASAVGQPNPGPGIYVSHVMTPDDLTTWAIGQGPSNYHAATKGYVDGATNAAVMKSGDAITGTLGMQGTLSIGQDSGIIFTNKEAEDERAWIVYDTAFTYEGFGAYGSDRETPTSWACANPELPNHAATKSYVDGCTNAITPASMAWSTDYARVTALNNATNAIANKYTDWTYRVPWIVDARSGGQPTLPNANNASYEYPIIGTSFNTANGYVFWNPQNKYTLCLGCYAQFPKLSTTSILYLACTLICNTNLGSTSSGYTSSTAFQLNITNAGDYASNYYNEAKISVSNTVIGNADWHNVSITPTTQSSAYTSYWKLIRYRFE